MVEGGAKVVVIDSLNGYLSAMPEERFLTTHLHELFAYLNQQGVVTIVVVAQHGLLAGECGAELDVSYLADTVFLLRYFEVDGPDPPGHHRLQEADRPARADASASCMIRNDGVEVGRAAAGFPGHHDRRAPVRRGDRARSREEGKPDALR